MQPNPLVPHAVPVPPIVHQLWLTFAADTQVGGAHCDSAVYWRLCSEAPLTAQAHARFGVQPMRLKLLSLRSEIYAPSTVVYMLSSLTARFHFCMKVRFGTNPFRFTISDGRRSRTTRPHISQISMTFKNQQVLTNCSWEVKKGERVGFVGESQPVRMRTAKCMRYTCVNSPAQALHNCVYEWEA